MNAIFTNNHRNLDKQTDALSKAINQKVYWTINLTKKTRNSVYNYNAGESYSLFFPLQPSAYETVFIHDSVELYETDCSKDFLARALNAVSRTGNLYLGPNLMNDTVGAGKLTKKMVLEVLGDPNDVICGFWSYSGRKLPLAENHSILGWYYNQHAKIVESNVTGGLIVGKSSEFAKAILGNILYPGDNIDTFPKRLPRRTIVEIVNKVRSGEIIQNNKEPLPALENITYDWSWDSHGNKFRQYRESWENYLIPGNIYKAATIASIIRRLFPGRVDLSFIEHGGNAGLLTAQLLLEMEDMLTLGVCCEIDIVPLLNARNIHHHYSERLDGRMFVRNASADSIDYDREFSIVAFVHMLLYVRRDILNEILQRAWDSIEPGGILLVFENTSPPTTLTGVDADIVFFRDELEEYLASFGEIEYAFPGTGQSAERKTGETVPLFRFVRKIAYDA